jgi:hypothetical protein
MRSKASLATDLICLLMALGLIWQAAMDWERCATSLPFAGGALAVIALGYYQRRRQSGS